MPDRHPLRQRLEQIARKEDWRSLNSAIEQVWGTKHYRELGDAQERLRDALAASMADPSWP
ncbi:hypothetical protein HNQ60_000704 [Povalibacter uvarum]|uniref:Uncharacterized protein n=1 Tax=Povalibacter uvarum TaxID=732238 RepID=A0A841HHX2_9GAMM|nr:hypothetical protein [Povalibacter uvarum]MBB6091858.1 hypothetical protein [Povalibacter uvarum]